MGKKSSKSQKKQFNNLINLLKPKVYITHSSNFKNLVQQLTGNNIESSSSLSISPPIISSSSSPPPPSRSPPDDHDQRMKFVHQYYYQEYSQELSVDSSEGSIPSSVNIDYTLHQPCFSLLDSNNYNYSKGSQEITDNISEDDQYYYRNNIESWLLEMDHDHHQYEGFGPLMNIHEEVSVDDYGYDLSTLF